jgi:hypothetical protein
MMSPKHALYSEILREYIATNCNFASLNEEWLHQNDLLKQVLREST